MPRGLVVHRRVSRSSFHLSRDVTDPIPVSEVKGRRRGSRVRFTSRGRSPHLRLHGIEGLKTGAVDVLEESERQWRRKRERTCVLRSVDSFKSGDPSPDFRVYLEELDVRRAQACADRLHPFQLQVGRRRTLHYSVVDEDLRQGSMMIQAKEEEEEEGEGEWCLKKLVE
eukprot:754044-Hanusia_phi.AAC.4